MVTYIPGSDLSHYYDSKHNREIVKTKAGEFFVTTHKFIIATVLGSCVAASIRDAQRSSAGMNHFMLPSAARPRMRRHSATVCSRWSR